MPSSPLDPFLPPVQAWFRACVGEPTRAQALGWPPIARGESTLLLAPTGSGKTLAAFLVAIDRLARGPIHDERRRGGVQPRRSRVLYVSPLKALAIDIERNLRAPLLGIAEHARRASGPAHAIRAPSVDVRTGDTSQKERARMRRDPADILITTPESLYLLLTSATARDGLATIDTLIVDEIHALVPTKRGAHFALSIERLEALRPRGGPPLQRIGLSATQRPVGEAARFLGGFDGEGPRAVTVVDTGARKELRIAVEDIAPGPANSPGVPARIVELVLAHRSTIVFVNSRRLAERLAAAINDLHRRDGAPGEIALAHHGSLAREKRAAIEERLKSGDLRAIVATSSLELGIDMGAVDLVIQIEAPPSVASGLQRVGRACHGVDGIPRGVLLPRHRQDLLACAAVAGCMRAGEVEESRSPRSPLDVLAQQIVAMASMDVLSYADLLARVRRAAPFSDLPQGAFDGVLDMLSGRYPSADFAEFRPRVTWDRARGEITARPGAHRLAVTNGGTIPDRGLVGVFTGTAPETGSRMDAKGAPTASAGGRRVGELDEEMVFELRVGEVFLLGASSWRTEAITHDRVLVTPAPGQPGKMPFWHGDRAGRARSLGERIGQLVHGIARRIDDQRLPGEIAHAQALEPAAADALVKYVRDQMSATGEVPSDRAIVVERFLDEMGDWRVVVLSPLGTRVIAPWAIAVASRLREAYVDVDLHYTDDGMAFRIPACEAPPPIELFTPSPDDVEAVVMRALDGTALFAARFRECAGRALLLPRRDPRRRTPLWAQRKRAADLLAIASRHPSFPIVLETYRECLRDVFDLAGLVSLLRDVASRRVRVTTVDGRRPSPFAASVLFAFVANFIYEGDAPVAERRALSMAIDFERLRELLGDAESRQLLDADVIAEHEARLQHLSRPATHLDAVHDLLLAIGELTPDELRARCTPADQADGWARQLGRAGRIVRVRIAGESRLAAAEDAARLRDALGITLPRGLPEALLEPSHDPLRTLVSRFARTHGPFVAGALASRFGTEPGVIEPVIAALQAERRLVEGAFLPAGADGEPRELCDAEVLDAIRRKSLAKLRRAVEPVGAVAYARFLLDWHGVPRARRGRDALLAVVAELEGCPLVASTLETAILPARLEGYRAWELDALCASGQVVWAGIDALGTADGRIALYRADQEPLLRRPAVPVESPVAARLRAVLASRGATFFADLAREAGGFPGEVLDTLWLMVWSGEVTNDTLEPLRSRARASSESSTRRSRSRPERPSRTGPTKLPGSEGRWSLRSSRAPGAPSDTDRRAALARSLLDRYGLVMRETAHAEGVAGGFAAIYEVLKVLEEQGRIRRGYFVEGRGGAQFALSGADERLRSVRDAPSDAESRVVVLAATDPANAWGAALDWPPTKYADRPQRSAKALVVLRSGALLGWLGRAGGPLLTFEAEDESARSSASRALAGALAGLVDHGDLRALLVSSVDGAAAAGSHLGPFLLEAGFTATTRGLFKRRSARALGETVATS